MFVWETLLGIRAFDFRSTVVVRLLRRHVLLIEANTGTIAATGTTPYTDTFWWFIYVSIDFTGTIAGNRHYSNGSIEGPLLQYKGLEAFVSVVTLLRRKTQPFKGISKKHRGRV